MNAELLMIGTELLLGQVQDTNASYMAQTLAMHGINLFQKTTVGDNPQRICNALQAALDRCDVVLCSGGLGPTEDDITRECVAEVLGRPLVYHEALYEAIRARFVHLRSKITENNKKQATLPEGAEAIENPHGTAPGVYVDDPRGVVVCMPGVPWELKPMLEEQVLPRLRQRFGIEGVLHSRVLKVCGMGESRVDSVIGDLVVGQTNPTVGLLASPDAVRIRLTARAESVEAARALVEPLECEIRKRLPGLIMGVDDDTLEGVVGRLLAARGWTLSVLETATGGAVSERLMAGAPDCFDGARILPRVPDPTEERALDLAGKLLLESPSCSALVLMAKPEEKQTLELFLTPEGQASWVIGLYGDSDVSRRRTAVVALENMRRYLSGVNAE